MSEENKTYSIALHIRRVIHEDDYVSVPVNEAIIKLDADGVRRIDFDAFVAEGIHISNNPNVEWKNESVEAQPHPVQGPRPEGRKNSDPSLLS